MDLKKNPDTHDALLVAGGLALMVFGAGLLVASPGIRRLLATGLGSALPTDGLFSGGVLPDMERYLKIRSM